MLLALDAYHRALRAVVVALAVVGGGGVVGMMLVTCADVLARACGHPLKGSYDIVRLLSLITLSCALPYTTAVKGHVAVEFFFNKLPWLGRVVVDSVMRLLMIGLFGLMGYQGVQYGNSLLASGEHMATLNIPYYWASYIMALSCALSALVVVHHLVYPRKVMLTP